jgi:hypothetical protein
LGFSSPWGLGGRLEAADDLDLDLDFGEDAGLLAGVEGVVDGFLDGGQEGLAGAVEAEEVAVLGEESETEISRCFLAMSSALTRWTTASLTFLSSGAGASFFAETYRHGCPPCPRARCLLLHIAAP